MKVSSQFYDPAALTRCLFDIYLGGPPRAGLEAVTKIRTEPLSSIPSSAPITFCLSKLPTSCKVYEKALKIRGSSVNIGTTLGAGQPGFDTWQGR
jgi:hypothetical protein